MNIIQEEARRGESDFVQLQPTKKGLTISI